MPSISRRRREQGTEDTESVARVRGALEGYIAANGPGVLVSAQHLLDLLNPRGTWKYDPERRKNSAAAPLGDGDPLTGCRPVTAPEGT